MTAGSGDRPAGAGAPDLVFQLLGTAHALAERVDDALRELGLSRAALSALNALVTAPHPPHARELAATARVLASLEQDGFVRRLSGATGPRIVITARGRARHRAGLERLEALRLAGARPIADMDAAAWRRALAALR